MMGKKKERAKPSIRSQLKRLTNGITIPLCVFAGLLIALLIVFSLQATRSSRNLATASQFSRSFKTDVDLKLYCYAAGTLDELPYEEVKTAKELARTLMDSTGVEESRRAIATVLNLCENLEKCMDDMQLTESYDERMNQLETNMYIITELLEEYIYNYLYFESGRLAAMQTTRNSAVSLAAISAVIAMALILVSTSVSNARITNSITRPVDELYNRVREIGSGKLEPHSPITAGDDKLQTLSDSIEQMVYSINSQMEQNRLKQIRIREMELALIQAQINPHFLYNTLDTIVWLIETEKYSAAEEMVGSLSTYFRSFLSNGRDIVTIEEELKHVRSYLEIQQVRYKDILSYDIQIDSRCSNCLIPKLTLQPLVENAIYHGIKLKRGGGKISVSIRSEGDRALIELRDTGAGMDEERLRSVRESLHGESDSFGLVSSYKRLELKYGADFGFEIDSVKNEGTVIRISIPGGAQKGAEQ